MDIFSNKKYFGKAGIDGQILIAALTIILNLNTTSSKAQPYIDLVYLKFANSPNSGLINQNKNEINIQYYNTGINLPLQFNHKKDAVIFSPYYEKWSSKINNQCRQHYDGIGLPVTLLKTIPNSKWGILLTGILRLNDSSIYAKGRMQIGAAFISSYKKNDNLTWKLGLYINNELFGLFVMPLVGLDWKINEKNNLFGVLPGNLTYEHKISKHLYYGANFRAITNSFAKTSGYWRIDENLLGLYLDTYFTKNLVLNVEAGHSLFRKVRSGVKNISTYDADINDNFYFKIAIAYRVRFAIR